MSESSDAQRPAQDGEGPPHGSVPDWAVGILIAEAVALVIALVTPLTPSKTGSDWSPADLFVPDPGYGQKVLAAFVMVNALIALLVIVVWLTTKFQRNDG